MVNLVAAATRKELWIFDRLGGLKPWGIGEVTFETWEQTLLLTTGSGREPE